jgi:hypothetical protein
MAASTLAAAGEVLAGLVGAVEAEMVEAVGHVAYEGTVQAGLVAQPGRALGQELAVREQILIPQDIGKVAVS